ncbi:MAG: hypothetical protein GY804_04635 [Alphaproteobacteria bacterium]|nr:hypothetical protein [Alphaproteobacteria bacterium]
MGNKKDRKNGQVYNDVSWPKIMQEVQMLYTENIGVVYEVKMIGNTEKARIDWGLHETWVNVFNLKEVDR